MKGKFKGKYKTDSPRLLGYNYSDEGLYYLTICTLNKKLYFGNIQNGEMHLSVLGEIAWKEWFRTIELRPDMNIELDEFVVMPNHIHGIIVINTNDYNKPKCRDTMHRVSTGLSYKNKFGSQSKNIASIIRGYKSSVTQYARKNGLLFEWQSGYYDHVIRDFQDFKRISKYIIENPSKWEEDKFYRRQDEL